MLAQLEYIFERNLQAAKTSFREIRSSQNLQKLLNFHTRALYQMLVRKLYDLIETKCQNLR